MKKRGLTSKQMSRMYRTARKTGYSKKRAYSAVGLAKALSKRTKKGPQKKLKRQHPYLDFDGDGVINKYDCQPRNKWKQDGDKVFKNRETGEPGRSAEHLLEEIEYNELAEKYLQRKRPNSEKRRYLVKAYDEQTGDYIKKIVPKKEMRKMLKDPRIYVETFYDADHPGD